MANITDVVAAVNRFGRHGAESRIVIEDKAVTVSVSRAKVVNWAGGIDLPGFSFEVEGNYGQVLTLLEECDRIFPS